MKRLSFTLLVLASGIGLHAQHNNRSARDLQFRFGNPGARSLAFGGAFVGLADDATAPVANPAGMSWTDRTSVSLEFQYEARDHEIPFSSGSITQTNLFEFDFDFQSKTVSDNRFRIPYAAVVIPIGLIRLGFFGHQQADLERVYTTDRIDVDLLSPTSSIDSYAPSTDVLDLEIINTGISVGSRIGDRWMWGVSAFLSDMSYRADSTIELSDQIGTPIPVFQTARGDDQDWGLTAGILLKVTDYFSTGVTYKRQAEFTYQAALQATRFNEDNPDFTRQGIFKVPDALALGFSARPSELTTVNLDINRVYYSEITDTLIDFANIPEVRQSMPDVTEIHLGFERAFVNATHPWFLRLGYWLDPYHAAINNIEDSQILRGRSDDPGIRDIFFLHQFADDVNHYALGLGWSFAQAFQIDAAIELSDVGEIATVSGIYRF